MVVRPATPVAATALLAIRAVPGLADHADLAGGPVRDRGGSVGVVRGRTAVEPVDDRLGAGHLLGTAEVFAACGTVGAGQVDADESVAARHEIVVVIKRHRIDDAVAVVVFHLSFVATAATGVIRRRFHDHRHLQPGLRRLGRSYDIDGHPVRTAVAVVVQTGVDPDAFADRVGVRIDRRRVVFPDTYGRRWAAEAGPAGTAVTQTAIVTRTPRTPARDPRGTRRIERPSIGGLRRAVERP